MKESQPMSAEPLLPERSRGLLSLSGWGAHPPPRVPRPRRPVDAHRALPRVTARSSSRESESAPLHRMIDGPRLMTLTDAASFDTPKLRKIQLFFIHLGDWSVSRGVTSGSPADHDDPSLPRRRVWGAPAIRPGSSGLWNGCGVIAFVCYLLIWLSTYPSFRLRMSIRAVCMQKVWIYMKHKWVLKKVEIWN